MASMGFDAFIRGVLFRREGELRRFIFSFERGQAALGITFTFSTSFSLREQVALGPGSYFNIRAREIISASS